MKKILEGVSIMFPGINVFIVTDNESSGSKLSQCPKH